ncbi:MAG TPA: hypothetical protein VE951_04865 [Candidatus Angelobacter sp.]|nr:hypothetical protein [Candidatus Angelobacter sp.]
METRVNPPRTADLVGGLLGVFGALVTILACALPFGHFSSDSGPVSPSIFHPESSDQLWYAGEPAAVIVMAIVGGLLVVFSRRGLVQISGAATLVALGIQTFFFFVGFTGYGLSGGLDEVGIGSVVGLGAGLCLLAGGVIAFVSIAGRATPPPSGQGPGAIV